MARFSRRSGGVLSMTPLGAGLETHLVACVGDDAAAPQPSKSRCFCFRVPSSSGDPHPIPEVCLWGPGCRARSGVLCPAGVSQAPSAWQHCF